MIEGHGDDLYRKYARTITANFSSNIYNGARHEGLTEHLCKALRRQAGQEGGQDLLSAYPEPEPYTQPGKHIKQLVIQLYQIRQLHRRFDGHILSHKIPFYIISIAMHRSVPGYRR